MPRTYPCSIEPHPYADNEPELIRFGVVERLAHRFGLDEDGAQRVEGEQILTRSEPAGSLEDDVELGRVVMAVPGRGLSRL